MAKALTVASVENIKPGKARREIPDALMPGLYLIIQPSGAKSWAVRYRLAGSSRKFTIGPYPAFGLLEARDEAGKVRRAAARGEDPSISRREARASELHKLKLLREAKSDSFCSIAEQFVLARRKSPRNRSWRETARLLGIRAGEEPGGAVRLDLIPGGIAKRWSARDIASITKREVREAVEAIAEADKGPLANRTLSAIRRLFNWAMQRDIVSVSPCEGVQEPASETSRTRILSNDEIRWLWLAADEQSYPFGHLAKLLLLTGQRRSEVAGIVGSEIDRISRQWLIPRERTKNARTQLVPLSNTAFELLRNAPARGLVLTQTGITPISGFSRAKRKLDKLMLEIASKEASDPSSAKIEGWTYHDLRRTVASGLGKLKVAPHVIEAVLNHASGVISGVAAIYNLYEYADEKREALDLWARHIDRVVGASSATIIPFAASAG